MTSPRRFEQDLPALLGDLYLAGTPVYRDDLVQQVARTPQRPAWTFPGRWLPMELVTTRVPATRLPMRQLGVLALIAIVLAAALAVYVGSQQAKLPPPFGVAGNGVIAYSKGGDIYTVDPITGTATPIVTGPDTDGRQSFSRDGMKLLFWRKAPNGDTFTLMAAASDGSNVHVVRDAPLVQDDVVEWSADSRYVLLTSSDSNITRYDETGATPATVVVRGARFLAGEIRPPRGEQILYEPDATPDVDLWIMDMDGQNARLVYRPPMQAQADIDQVRWSPDGTLIGFKCAQPGEAQNNRICVMDENGNDLRILDAAAEGDWVETDFVWSPDGKSIAFNRWHLEKTTGQWEIQSIGLADVASGTVTDLGPTPAPEGALFDFSPDGKYILSLPARFFRSTDASAPAAKPVSIDVATGVATEVSWDVASDVSWQRLAP